MEKITLDYSKTLKFVKDQEINSLQKKVNLYHDLLHNGTEEYENYLGWVDFPNNFDDKELKRIT